MTLLQIVSVFTNAAGGYGNLLGVFLDGNKVAEPQRQAVATKLGYSETVFVDDPEQGRVRLYTPAAELPFAGHPLVGTAWLLGQERGCVACLRPPAGEVPVRIEGDLVWIRGRPEWCPPWQHLQLGSVSDVEQATAAPSDHDAVQLWAVEDAAAGVVRARVFAPRFGVHEDEACGSASMLLAARLGRPLTIHHGAGSEIYVRPAPDGAVDLGGRVTLFEVHAAIRPAST